MRWLGRPGLGLPLLLLTVWATAALYFDVRVDWLRGPLAVAYLLAVLSVWFRSKRRGLAVVMTSDGFALVLGWWLTLPPSNDRNWQPDLTTLANVDIQGNRVTLHNIRDCDYCSETDFDVRHCDGTYDPDKIRTADLFMVYWRSRPTGRTRW